MEEIKAYIESGVLELYVLGQLQPEEMQEVEAMAAKYAAVKEEIEAIELALEQYAQANGIQPSEVFDNINFNRPVNEDDHEAAPPVKVVPLNTDNRHRTLRFALVACIALLIISLAALYTVYNQLGKANEQLVQLRSEKQQFTRNANFFEQQNNELKLLAAMPDHPEWAKVQLKGVGKSPEANLTVYWNKTDHKVMVNNSSKILPAHDAQHQFQLWALVDGKPVDLGVFDSASDQAKMLLEMKTITGAQAFAVTIEKLGGSPAPTMDQMVVMGYT